MSIKPVDYQVMLPRTMEAAKISNDEAQRNFTVNRQHVAATQHKAEDSLKQVYSRAQAQNARITDKQKETRQNNGKKRKGKGSSDSTEENSADRLNNSIKISTIDIRV